MGKKWISLMLTLVLLCVSVSAFAAASKTTRDLTNVLQTINETGVPLGTMVGINGELSAQTRTELAAITAFVAGNKPAVEYFGADVQAAAASQLPAGVAASSLILSECVSLTIGDYQTSYGDITSTIGFATQFDADQPIVVLFGYTDANGNMVWQPLQAVVVNGMVRITFPADLLEKAGSSATLAILSK